MAYPTDIVVTGDLITAAQINRWEVLLADELLTVAAATIDFTAIPAHWTHLKVVVYARSDEAVASVGAMFLRFNGDSGANYDSQVLDATGTTPTAAQTFGATRGACGVHPRGTSGADLFSVTEILIPHYAGIADNKAAFCLSGSKVGVASLELYQRHVATFWRSSAAIDRVTILPEAGNFDVGSRATLYGMGRL